MSNPQVEVETYTVIGIIFETKQRYADHIEAASGEMAERIAQTRMQAQGGTLVVAGTVRACDCGEPVVTCDGYAPWFDQDAATQEQAEQAWGEMDRVPTDPYPVEDEQRKPWWRS